MLVTKSAVFFIFDSAGLFSLVLRRGIIPMLANGAFECNYVPHEVPLFFSELTTGLEPVTYALPRRCSTS